jgi:hypothetical protein
MNRAGLNGIGAKNSTNLVEFLGADSLAGDSLGGDNIELGEYRTAELIYFLGRVDREEVKTYGLI